MLLRAMAAAGAHVLRSWAWYALQWEGVFEHSFVVDHLCCNAVEGTVKLNGHDVCPVLAAERQRAFLGGLVIDTGDICKDIKHKFAHFSC